MTESERELGRRWFELVWNQGRREAIAEMLAPDAVVHDGNSDASGPEGFYPFYDRLRAALSEIRVEVHGTVAEGDMLCVRWSCTGKHTGDGLAIDPTGVTVHVTGITILRIADGRLVEGWQNWDMLGMLEQIRRSPRAATYIT
jgi:predicted ester cyclase